MSANYTNARKARELFLARTLSASALILLFIAVCDWPCECAFCERYGLVGRFTMFLLVSILITAIAMFFVSLIESMYRDVACEYPESFSDRGASISHNLVSIVSLFAIAYAFLTVPWRVVPTYVVAWAVLGPGIVVGLMLLVYGRAIVKPWGKLAPINHDSEPPGRITAANPPMEDGDPWRDAR